MTVGSLIERLLDMPRDAEVRVWDDNYNDDLAIGRVDYVPQNGHRVEEYVKAGTQPNSVVLRPM